MDSMIDKIRAAEQQAEDIRAQAVADARDMAVSGKVLSAQVLLEAREVVAREETAARAKLKDAVAYLMERVDTQV